MTATTPLVAWKSQQGTRGKANDDHFGWFAVDRNDLRRTVYVALVADGVTSTEGGAQASRIAVEAVRAALSERPDPHETLSEWLARAVYHANEEILFEAKRTPQWKGMSTTIVLAALAGEKLYVMHLGDSRAYLLRGNRLYQLTTDHTWAQEALEAGTISVEEAERHPGRNQLQRYLGAQHAVNVARGALAPGSGYAEEYLLLQPGDTLLLCTDGIYRRLPGEAIKQTVVEHNGYPQNAVDALVAAAAANGEVDDITALVVEVPSGRPTPVDSTRSNPYAVSVDSTRSNPYAVFEQQESPRPSNSPLRSTFFWIGAVFLFVIAALYLLLNMQ